MNQIIYLTFNLLCINPRLQKIFKILKICTRRLQKNLTHVRKDKSQNFKQTAHAINKI